MIGEINNARPLDKSAGAAGANFAAVDNTAARAHRTYARSEGR